MINEIEKEETSFTSKPTTIKRNRRKSKKRIPAWLVRVFQSARMFAPDSHGSVYGYGRHRDGNKGRFSNAIAKRHRGNQIARMSRRANRA